MNLNSQELDIQARKEVRRKALMEQNLRTRVVEDKKRKNKKGYKKHKKRDDESYPFLFYI